MQAINQKTMFCTKCGSKNNEINLFCSECGNEFERVKVKNDVFSKVNTDKIGEIKNNNFNTNLDIDKNDLEKFINKNSDYYIRKFEDMKITGSKISWNWAAFFLTGNWMLYRKIYIQTIIFTLVGIVLAQLPDVDLICSLGMYVGLGMYGNTLYLAHINKKMSDINKYDLNMREQLMFKKGGTNLALPLILIFGGVLIYFIIFAIFGIAFTSMMYY